MTGQVFGYITLDGSISDWTDADLIFQDELGFRLYGTVVGGAYVFAMTEAGPGTTLWLNTDRDASTGYQLGGPLGLQTIYHPGSNGWSGGGFGGSGGFYPPYWTTELRESTFAGGAEYKVDIASNGAAVFSQTPGPTYPLGDNQASGPGGAVEFAVPMSLVPGTPATIELKLDINDLTFVSETFVLAPPLPTIGDVTLDGDASDWTAAERLDDPTNGWEGFAAYGKAAEDHFLIAIAAPIAIGANSTVWLNTDDDATTGYQIWGWAGGAEYNVNFDAAGVPHLYGENFSADLQYAVSADRQFVELAIPKASLGSPSEIKALFNVNDAAFLPHDYHITQYTIGAGPPEPPPPAPIESITIDGDASDWTAAERLDDPTNGWEGFGAYGTAIEDAFMIAIAAPIAIDGNTTIWLNTDDNDATGYRIWGWAGGAEYNVNFDAAGIPHLYGVNYSADLEYAFSPDRKFVELAIPKSLLGSPSEIKTLFDINDAAFLPHDYHITQYAIGEGSLAYSNITLDGSLDDWAPTFKLPVATASGTATFPAHTGSGLYGTSDGGAFLFALKGPFNGAQLLLDTDHDTSTGATVFGGLNESMIKVPGQQYTLGRGIDYRVSIADDGAARLLTGNGSFVSDLPHAISGDVVEFALPQTMLADAPDTARLQLMFYNGLYGTPYVPASVELAPAPKFGDVTLDGTSSDWTAAERLDDPTNGWAGFAAYGTAVEDTFLFAIAAPVAIGANTTIWLNTDDDATTGYQIWGWAGGAEYNVNFDAAGVPHLYGENFSADLQYAVSADRQFVELAIPKASLGSPSEIKALFDINDAAFLPHDYHITQYTIGDMVDPSVAASGGADDLLF